MCSTSLYFVVLVLSRTDTHTHTYTQSQNVYVWFIWIIQTSGIFNNIRLKASWRQLSHWTHSLVLTKFLLSLISQWSEQEFGSLYQTQCIVVLFLVAIVRTRKCQDEWKWKTNNEGFVRGTFLNLKVCFKGWELFGTVYILYNHICLFLLKLACGQVPIIIRSISKKSLYIIVGMMTVGLILLSLTLFLHHCNFIDFHLSNFWCILDCMNGEWGPVHLFS